MTYNPEEFFAKRFEEFGMGILSAGNRGKTEKENLEEYTYAARVIEKEFSGCFSEAVLLDIGVGTGFYIPYFFSMGILSYTGIDITNVLFEEIFKSAKQPVALRADDISEKLLLPEKLYDVIAMIDVTQHIVDNKKFKQAMDNVKFQLKDDGIFIVTSHLKTDLLFSEYERFRPMSFYEKEFEGYEITDPVPFRDKWIFSIRKKA